MSAKPNMATHDPLAINVPVPFNSHVNTELGVCPHSDRESTWQKDPNCGVPVDGVDIYIRDQGETCTCASMLTGWRGGGGWGMKDSESHTAFQGF